MFYSSCSHSGQVCVSISEASIRSDLLFVDVDGIGLLPNQAIFDAIQQMGLISSPVSKLVTYLLSNRLFNPQDLHPTTIPDSIPETSGENLGGHSSSDRSLSGNEGDMTLQSVYDLCLSLCAQVSDQAKEIQHLKAQITKLKKQAKTLLSKHP
ncbi:hypothetical protein Tco_0669624 [Tanacetum coccineum]